MKSLLIHIGHADIVDMNRLVIVYDAGTADKVTEGSETV